jgi:hypothetical protein
MECSPDLRQALLAALPGVLIALDAHGDIQWTDDRVEALLGWRPEDLVGRGIDVLLPDWPDPSRPPRLRQDARRRDFGEVAVTVTASPVDDAVRAVLITPAGPPAQAEPPAVDDADLARRLEDLGHRAGTTAHDIANLLGVISNYSVMLTRQLSEPAAAADVGMIRAAADRAVELTRQLEVWAGAERRLAAAAARSRDD